MSVGSSRASVIFLCVIHLCVWWTLCHGQTCYSTELEGTCSRSDSCRAEHGREEDNECVSLDQTESTVLPNNVQRCSVVYSGDQLFHSCESKAYSSSENTSSTTTFSDINASFYSISWHSFAVNVSWEHLINPAQGYQLKFSYGYGLFSTFGCYCIYDPNLRNFETELHFFDLHANRHFLIELSLIHSSLVSSTLITERYTYPTTCLDIPHTDSTCALPTYGPPTNLTMYHETLKLPSFHDTLPNILHIKWSYAYQTEFPHPSEYYIEVFDIANLSDDRYYSYFVVNNTKSVAILHDSLNNSIDFHVGVRPYFRCSGLANKLSGLGCGSSAISVSAPVPAVAPADIPSAGIRYV